MDGQSDASSSTGEETAADTSGDGGDGETDATEDATEDNTEDETEDESEGPSIPADALAHSSESMQRMPAGELPVGTEAKTAQASQYWFVFGEAYAVELDGWMAALSDTLERYHELVDEEIKANKDPLISIVAVVVARLVALEATRVNCDFTTPARLLRASAKQAAEFTHPVLVFPPIKRTVVRCFVKIKHSENTGHFVEVIFRLTETFF